MIISNNKAGKDHRLKTYGLFLCADQLVTVGECDMREHINKTNKIHEGESLC